MELFCREGFRAIGIDRILKDSGVAKKTLYNHFKSKDDLIIATLEKRGDEFLGSMRVAVERLAPVQNGDPRIKRALAYFDALQEAILSDGFSGCAFINASADYPQQDDPIHLACAEHKRAATVLIEELLSDIELTNPQLVAKQLALMADGAVVNAYTGGDPQAAQWAKLAARRVLESYLV
jgi:AcrR family transcriptional regulator